MYLSGVLLVLSLFFINSVYCHKSVRKIFEDVKIVPDVLKQAPNVRVLVNYNDKQVQMGTVLTPTEVQSQPDVNYKGKPGMFYTLLLVDPDAPSHVEPRAREWQHWLVGNIPGNDIASGEVFTEYVGSLPPKKSGMHRYVFIVYEHKEKITFTEPIRKTNSGKRGKFKTESFATKYGLGVPYAGNYFKSEYDDSVPTLLKQLGLID